MSINSIKKIFKRKKTNDAGIGHTKCNDWLENFIKEKKIECYKYSDFKDIQSIGRQNVVRANLKDKIFVLKYFNNDDNTIRQVVCELESLRTIVHENILQFYGITRVEDGIPCESSQINKHMLVLEYADSGTLDTYLNEYFNNLNWNDKLNLALQLANAVLYLHNNNIFLRRNLVCIRLFIAY
ncbi:kinase-like domain-containing protein [Glomus cerebriforme]|uniref:Kinase-like domain-containing protein n=1 Tax=Glomus cerebriforme TaxID=658196 RepID=A0A397TI91_9GLOM|nr:kinase-like domain-containing protein [Glomus cerebriforme]